MKYLEFVGGVDEDGLIFEGFVVGSNDGGFELGLEHCSSSDPSAQCFIPSHL